jgi:hexosaminidase
VRNEDVHAVRTLVSIVEPVKEYRRYEMRPQVMLSPLTGLIDATPPDSDEGRRFAMMVEAFLSDAPRFELYRDEILDRLSAWQSGGLVLDPIIDRSPGLDEARPLAKNLSELGAAGREAISYIKSGTAPTTNWRDAKLARLEEAAKPKAGLEFVVIPSLRKLVIAATELSKLNLMTPAEWNKQVSTLATPAKK